MASEVYFKFKSSVKTDSIRFDGSAISVKELKDAIKNKCCLRSADLDLKLEDSTGKGTSLRIIYFFCQSTQRMVNSFRSSPV